MLAAAQLPTCSPLCGDEEGEKEEHWYSDAIESSPEPQARSALSWSLSSGHLQAGGGPRCCSLWLTPLLHCLGSRHWEDPTTEGDSLLSPRKILRWFFLWKSGLKQQQQKKKNLGVWISCALLNESEVEILRCWVSSITREGTTCLVLSWGSVGGKRGDTMGSFSHP